MRSAKDLYIELLAQGHTPQDIDDELLCQMMDEEREALEMQQEREMEQKEQGGVMDTYLNEGGE